MNIATKTVDPASPATRSFEAAFGSAPAVQASAPGRLNLMGEHTDYNGGSVLPMALKDLQTVISMDRGAPSGTLHIHSQAMDGAVIRPVDDAARSDWSDYILGCFQRHDAVQATGDGYRISVASSIPLGAGLSSSAALEVAVLRALDEIHGRTTDPVETAKIAKAVENEYVGLPCGIMDQFACSVGIPDQAMFLNTQTLEHGFAPRAEGATFVVIHSGVGHQLTQDGYATRVAECNRAASELGVACLGHLTPGDLSACDHLSDPLFRRVRHIVTDSERVMRGVSALSEQDAAAFGALMTQSHRSQRDNFEITVPQTDAIVDFSNGVGALGARQTGGGFGGAVVALVEHASRDDFCRAVTREFPAARIVAQI